MEKKLIRSFKVLMLSFLFLVNSIQNGAIVSYAAELSSNIETIIDDTVTIGDSNYFRYYGEGWVASGSGNGTEHYNVLKNGEKNPQEKYYTVDFIGNRIEVYGNKTAQNGKIKFSIFNEGGELIPKSDVIVDARVDNTNPMYAWGGLPEGKYVLKAEATGINSNTSHSQAVIQVDKVKISHKKYSVNSINLESNIELIEGATKQLETTVTPSYAKVTDLVYSSDNESVVKVSSSGLITSVSEGIAKITVTSSEFNKSASTTITVKKSNGLLHGSIVDTNTHYTQDRYNEVMKLGTVSEDLYGWKADKVISEIALASKDGRLNNVSISSSDFISGENVISKDSIVTTFIKETKAYIGDAGYHNSPNSGPSQTPNDDNLKKDIPDILYSSEPMNIEANKVQPVWVEMNIPENALPGVYTGTITVSADGIDNLNFKYSLEVLDISMPKSNKYDFDIELWQYPYSSAEYYGVEPFSEEHFNILRPHMEKYKELGGHAITTSIVEEAWGGQTYSENSVRYPSMVKWTRKSDGKFTFDFTDFDKWVQFNRDLGIGDKIIAYSMIPWGNKVSYYDEASNQKKSETLTPGSGRYEEVWLQFLNKFVSHLDEKAWFDYTYIGIDERSNMDKAFDVIDKVKNRHDKSLKKSAAMDHFDASKKYITDRVDDLSVGSTAAKQSLEGYRDFVQERKNSDKEYKTTIYTCTEHFPNSLVLSTPGESYWTMMFTAAQGSTGYLRWAYDAWVKDPLRDTTHWAFEAGDPFLIYPDEKDSANKVSKTSVRLEKISEGVRDVNKLYLMKKEIPALKADIDNLFKTVELNYTAVKNGIGQHGGAKYATPETIVKINEDMKSIRNEIKNISKKYISLRSSGSNTIESVKINEGDKNIFVGDKSNLTVSVLPKNTLNPDVKWTSSNTNIATVDSDGVVTGVKIGVAKITATSVKDITKTSTINIVVNKKVIEDSAKVAYYSFDDIKGTLVNDIFTNGKAYNGKLIGAEVVDGKSGKALKFNKDSDEVVIDSPAELANDWTIAFWVKKGNSTGISSVMWNGRNYTESAQKNSESIDLTLGVGLNSNNAGVHVNNGTLSFKYQVPTNKWVHMTVTNSTNEGLSLFVDGNKIGDTNAYTKTNHFKAPLKIIGGRGFIGELDEVKIYNRALTLSEISEVKAINGLNVDSNYKEVLVGEKTKIIAELITDKDNKTVEFTSSNPNIATVDSDGTFTGVAYGDTVITVENKASGYLEKVNIRVNKKINLHNTLKTHEIDRNKQIVVDREAEQYLGQPDSILLDDNKTILTVYPKGHGFGEALLSKSTDGGLTWEKRLATNETWKLSEETPTIFKLNFTNGSKKIISISGGPGWHGSTFKGFKTSISEDEGNTWSDYKKWSVPTETIVAMASLVQLKDENGNYIDKWMGIYHDYNYVNYKTYLTFDDNGQEQWSTAVPYLSEFRDIEKEAQICEVGMFRSPDESRIVALARSQSHKHTSMIFYSDDEGKTWSRPRQVQGSLNGERHKATYDPISGRLLISFREIKLDTNNNGSTSDNDWMAGDWVGWVGTYDDLMNGNEGQYRIILGKDYTKSARAGDCGYAGNVVMKDGTYFLNAYGNFDENTNNKTYIMGVRFKLSEIDKALGIRGEN
ncbi:Ig-like domain-containing protein [Clostridium carnis]